MRLCTILIATLLGCSTAPHLTDGGPRDAQPIDAWTGDAWTDPRLLTCEESMQLIVSGERRFTFQAGGDYYPRYCEGLPETWPTCLLPDGHTEPVVCSLGTPEDAYRDDSGFLRRCPSAVFCQ